MTTRMFVVGVMLLLSSWAVRAVGHGAPVELRQPFSQFPNQVATWQGEDQRFTARIEEKLGVSEKRIKKLLRAKRQLEAVRPIRTRRGRPNYSSKEVMDEVKKTLGGRHAD